MITAYGRAVIVDSSGEQILDRVTLSGPESIGLSCAAVVAGPHCRYPSARAEQHGPEGHRFDLGRVRATAAPSAHEYPWRVTPGSRGETAFVPSARS